LSLCQLTEEVQCTQGFIHFLGYVGLFLYVIALWVKIIKKNLGLYGRVLLREGEIKLSKKRKWVFQFSIVLNILLFAIAAWGIVKMNFVKEQVLITEVQSNLVELEGLIASQIEDNWSEPNLVTTELGDVLNGIWLGKTTGKQLGTLTYSDQRILEHLYSKLNQYPNDKLYSFVDLTEEDKKNFE
jgi:hypothetical protein